MFKKSHKISKDTSPKFEVNNINKDPQSIKKVRQHIIQKNFKVKDKEKMTLHLYNDKIYKWT